MAEMSMARAAISTPIVTLSDTEGRIDMPKMRRYRMDRLRRQIRAQGYGAGLFFDPINIRYATGRRGHPTFGLHIAGRSVFVPADGPVVMFDAASGERMVGPLEMIDEFRTNKPLSYFFGGDRTQEHAKWHAKEIGALMKKHARGNKRIALDRIDLYLLRALEAQGLDVKDGQETAERARSIKSVEEIMCMKFAIAAAEAGMGRMREVLKPGMTENELWSYLHQVNIAMGGEWIDARLMASGDRTNPWGQESSDRVISAGEIVAFDTDMVGPFGYCADISRTFLCPPGKPTPKQKDLYKTAYEQLEHNLHILKAGMSFHDYARKTWKIPKKLQPNRYMVAAHGIGMCDEYPSIYYPMDWERTGFDGIIEENMTICVESYVGPVGEREGVKLEHQVLVTKQGPIVLSTFPFEEDFLK